MQPCLRELPPAEHFQAHPAAAEESLCLMLRRRPRHPCCRSSKEDNLWIWKFQENDMYLELDDEARGRAPQADRGGPGAAAAPEAVLTLQTTGQESVPVRLNVRGPVQ